MGRLSQVRRIRLTEVPDERGRLTAVEGGRDISFDIARIFFVHHVTAGNGRGGHAHTDTDQVLIAVHGEVKVGMSDGKSVQVATLRDASEGLYVPRMIWIWMFDFSEEAVLLVLANTHYDKKRSLRTWADYLRAKRLPLCREPKGLEAAGMEMSQL